MKLGLQSRLRFLLWVGCYLANRKEIIIKEIHYWKKHRLLPEHYCDFLLALYTGGNDNTNYSTNQKQLYFRRGFTILLITLLIILFPITFLVIYFTEMSSLMQIALTTILILVGLVGGIWGKRNNNPFLFHFSIVGLAFILLTHSVKIADLYFNEQRMAMGIILFLNCVLWLISGFLLKLPYLLLSGGFGLVIFLVFLLL